MAFCSGNRKSLERIAGRSSSANAAGRSSCHPCAFSFLLSHSRTDSVSQVLEIDAGSFAPTLSLKYGTLLPQRDSPFPLRIRLHPACCADNAEDVEEEPAWGKQRLRFGQEVVDELYERDAEVYEGEWDAVKRLDC